MDNKIHIVTKILFQFEITLSFSFKAYTGCNKIA